ncbi:serine/threonine-protein kinase [Actinocorallia populi]|uniref:serine/threonine-protein kinase n=1 Tax=Actinocorallia populi TaxID=2079200 RepID=UPI000D094FDF|nr:serine/threonine-protein kinase [Actinocorallia populi]
MRDLPEYRELRELGSGAQGRVVLAQHGPSGRIVAVKFLHRAKAAAVARFRDEAVLLQRVESPHVAALYEFRELADGAAIVMEAVDGTSLRALLDEHGALTPEAALLVLKGSLLGLEAAHRLGIVHRDYKPANVIVTGEGQSKLIDFGVAVFAGSRGGSGTPSYMAPEQWTREAATPATDVYAATCVFFECVTGRLPFRDGLLSDLHRLAPVPVEEVPEPLRGLIMRGMAKDASARPPSAQSFVIELEAAATAAYGRDWEARGRAVLGGIAAGMLGGAMLSTMVGGTAATTAATTAKTGLSATILGSTSLTVASAVLSVLVTASVSVFAVQKFTGDQPSPPAVAASTPTKPSLAYMTNSAVIVSGPDGRPRKVASLSGRAPGDSLVWSASGSWLAWTTAKSKNAGGDKVHLASADGRKAYSWDCADGSCGTAVFRGEQLVTAERTSRQLVLYPHGDGPPRKVPITGLAENPFPDFPPNGPSLEAATRDTLIVYYGVGTSAYGGPVAYYRVSENGQAALLFDDDGRGNVGPHSFSVSPDERTLVYIGARRGGHCEHYESVRLSDLATGQVTEPEMPAGYVTVKSTWYDASGVLNGTFLPQEKECPNADAGIPRGPALFRLASGAWTPAGRGTSAARFAKDGSEARLTGLSVPATLTVSRDGRTTRVPKVSLFAWSP